MADHRINLVRSDLETCLALIGLAEAEIGVGDLARAAATLADAEKGHAVVTRFLAEFPQSPEDLKAELESKLGRLRTRIDELKQRLPQSR
jgi:ATP/maltotriose-dependent transcriptional regulator MalT